jgi:DNA-3-methyladenine glycosylase II
LSNSDLTSFILGIDSAFEPVISKFPIFPLVDISINKQGSFVDLVRIVIGQQLSGKAAQSISERLAALVEISPESIFEAEFDLLRSAGLSAAKTRSIKELSQAVMEANLDLAQLPQLPDALIRAQLTQIWGIGNWTVDMFLMFQLGRADIWPVNDLGVRKGWQLIHGDLNRPTAAQLQAFGEPFVPNRSAIAWYCWRALEL